MNALTYKIEKTEDYRYNVVLMNGNREVTDFGPYETKREAQEGANRDSMERQDAPAIFWHPLDNAEVGDGATYTIHSDSQAGTIIARTPKSITWQRDNATLLNGPKSGEEDALVVTPGGFAAHTEGRQRYTYDRDTNGHVVKFTRRVLKNKFTGEETVRWVASGHGSRSPGCYLTQGRNERYDYNF